MSDFKLTIKTFLEQLNETAITIQDHVTVKIINSLGPKFETYVTVLKRKARNEKVVPDLDTLWKSLEEEEIWMAEKSLLNKLKLAFPADLLEATGMTEMTEVKEIIAVE